MDVRGGGGVSRGCYGKTLLVLKKVISKVNIYGTLDCDINRKLIYFKRQEIGRLFFHCF